MPDAKISELPAVSNLSDSDITPFVQGSGTAAETRRATLSSLRAGVLAERTIHVRDYGAVGNGTTDDTAAIQAAIDAAAASTNGIGVVLLGPKRYLIDSAELIIKAGVTLRGQGDPGGWRINVNYSAVPYALIVNPAYTIRLRRNSTLENCAILRKGMTTPTSVRTGLDAVKAFAGTGVCMGDGTTGSSGTNGTDSSLRRLLILGFETGIRCAGSSRVRISDITGDCTNGLWLGNNYDISHIQRVNWHPLVTTGMSWTGTSYTLTNVTNNGNGLFRVTTSSAHALQTGDIVNVYGVTGATAANGRWIATVIDATTIDLQGSTASGTYLAGGVISPHTNRRTGIGFYILDADMPKFVSCFEYGHDIGWYLDTGAHAVQLINCGCDNNGAIGDTASIGVVINGGSSRTKWYGGFWAAKGKALVVNSTTADQHEISGVMLTAGGTGRSVEVQNGAVTLNACDIYGEVYMGANSRICQIIGCDTKSASFSGETPAAAQRLVMAGNRVAFNGGTQRVVAGTVELTAIDGNGALATRLSARSDGPVAIHRRASGTGAQLRLHGGADTVFGSVSVTGNDIVLAGEAGVNANPAFIFGGTAMTQPLSMRLRRTSASPAANDRLGQLELAGNNSAATETTFARVTGIAETVTSGAEAGAVIVETRSGGTIAERMRIASSGTVTLTGPLVLPADPSASLQAATKQYVDNQFTGRAIASLTLSAATALTLAAHNNRLLVANSGASLSIDWSATGNGFSCMIYNRTSSDLAITMSNFSATTPANPDGMTKIRAGGLASLIAISPDGGTTKLLLLTGAGAA
ncbi:hypothetical protein IAI18_10650 [Acetobacteraceae bacterium H6797]|nr:hypothetical protein [Acetobacteraceae bacterium H6797]